MDFPRTVDEITPEWLTQVLRESGAIREATVVQSDASNIGVDQGVVAQVHRLELKYDRTTEDAPGHVIAKLALQVNLDSPELGDAVRTLYDREVRFFLDLAPESGMQTPAVYYANFDPTTGHFIILLEDLSHLRAVDQADESSPKDSSAAMRALASMHSKWWNNDELHGFQWLADHPWAAPANVVSQRFPNNVEPFLKIADGHVPDGIEALCNKLIPKISEVWAELSSPPVSLNHGDFRLANMFFDDSGGDIPRVIVYDWQLTGRIRPADDVATFMLYGFTPRTRKAVEKSLLTEYHDSLREQGVRDYSYEQFIDDFRLALLPKMVGRVISTVAVDSGLRSIPEGRARLNATIERLQVLIDWNCEEVIPK
ncbi:MAG: DUF1679 domain-containing protein [Chloroflexi bacterium]|nr:DUF1679 domain-containing protein [Chloroflexota bacterium]